VPVVVEIGQTAAEIWGFFDFFKMNFSNFVDFNGMNAQDG